MRNYLELTKIHDDSILNIYFRSLKAIANYKYQIQRPKALLLKNHNKRVR